MASNNIELTRRKILASIGAVGAAGAGAGMGTSALFTDEESFEDNSITAGTLDMKVDWEEHYSYPQLYGLGDPADGLDVTRMEPSDPSSYTAFPPGVEADSDGDPILWVHDDDVTAFHENTSIEAFPDTGSNGTADDGIQDDFVAANACEVLGDLDGGDGALDSGDRTDNAATSPGDPLVNLQDVKPGDFGEVTLSFHLCDNPGYVWMQADDVTADEVDVTEPENESVTEDGDPDSTDPADVELLDEIQTAMWYDNDCNNLTDSGTTTTGTDADVALVLDDSGSISGSESDIISAAKAFIDELASSDQAATVAFGETASVEKELTLLDTTQNVDDVKDSIDNYPGSVGGGSTNIDGGLEKANQELESTRARGSATPVIVILSDGAPNVNNGVADDNTSLDDDFEAALEEGDVIKSSGKRIISLGFDLTAGGDAENLLRAIAGVTANSESEYVDYTNDSSNEPDDEGDYFAAPDPTDLEGQFQDIAGEISQDEEIFFQGDLRTALNHLTDGDGIPLDGDGGDDFAEVGSSGDSGDPPDAASRGCFEPTPATHCIGFSWWIPTEVGNQIQSDSVTFDLGFYAEQCRNNDGSGDTPTSTSTSSGT